MSALALAWTPVIVRTTPTPAPSPKYELSREDAELLAALRAGNESAFAELLRRFGPAMLRVALLYVGSRAVAEEVVQEAWVGVLKGLERFEGRSSLKTWIFRILTNIAKTRGEREGRSIPFSAFADAQEQDGSAVDPDRFLGPDSVWEGHWSSATAPLAVPEERLLAAEAQARIDAAIAALPPNQRAVLTLRDVSGFDAEEAAELLGVSEGNQRVLLHRARARVREAFEAFLREAA
jgi:RNA polymerase sigma-70 factor (ECF subfamily)